MTLRAPSRFGQWVRWAAAAAVAAAVYVVLKTLLFGEKADELLSPYSQRILLPVLAVFLLVAWETRWDGVVRLKFQRHEKVPPRVHKHRHRPRGAEGEEEKVGGESRLRDGESRLRENVPASPSEVLYLEARKISHRKIPDPERDAVYLEMLGKAALAGYGRALEKLGTYAIRRREWLEAYYWLWQAQRRGVRNLEPLLRKARQHWVKQGFPRHGICVSAVFTKERTEIGRALLCQASGHDAAAAREFLKAHPAEESIGSEAQP